MTTRTTVRLPDALLHQAKRRAAAEGRTLTALIEQGLRIVVSSKSEPKPTRQNDPPVSAARGGLRSGINWDNLTSLVQQTDDLEYIERLTQSE